MGARKPNDEVRRPAVATPEKALRSGSAAIDISPDWPIFLAGYPHAERISEGINDPLLASALFLDDGVCPLMMISLDVIFISPKTATEIRGEIRRRTGIPASNILISCTHTHSGPLTSEMNSFEYSDMKTPDSRYMKLLAGKVVSAAEEAVSKSFEAEIAFTAAQVSGAGCNRHDPAGPRDPEAGIIAVRDRKSRKIRSLSIFYSMHPTVLHEDTKKVSSDFPGYARLFLGERLGDDPVIVYHTGTAGNQSPRYDVRGQTFAEARRIGEILGQAVLESVKALSDSDFSSQAALSAKCSKVKIPPRVFPSVAEADAKLEAARAKFARLKEQKAGHGPVRTAECDVFGAESTLCLAKAQEDGRLRRLVEAYSPAEVIVLGIGPVRIAGFPCEVFVELGLELKRRSPARVFPVSLANGELQGYIVTKEASLQGGYEASNAVFSPEGGDMLVAKMLEMIQETMGADK